MLVTLCIVVGACSAIVFFLRGRAGFGGHASSPVAVPELWRQNAARVWVVFVRGMSCGSGEVMRQIKLIEMLLMVAIAAGVIFNGMHILAVLCRCNPKNRGEKMRRAFHPD